MPCALAKHAVSVYLRSRIATEILSSNSMDEFASITPGFCPNCGSILPHMRPTGKVKCSNCCTEWPPEVFGTMKTEYTIHFNTYTKKKNVAPQEEGDEGPVVERTCPKCGNDKMSYATLQLRSADEGQTVFFTCTVCKFKETENS